MYAKLMET